MNKRPLSITIISLMLIAVCGSALVAEMWPTADPASIQRIAEFKAGHPFEYASGRVVHAIAVVCGLFMLRGCNWARWLFVAWLGFHIVISFLNSLSMGLAHVLLFSVILYLLFERRAAAYFRSVKV